MTTISKRYASQIKRLYQYFILLMIAVATLEICTQEAVAQPLITPDTEDTIIDDIQIRGNKRNSAEDLLYYIKQGKGKPLSLETVSADVKRLYKMKLFDDIQVDLDVIAGQTVLTYYLKEKPSVSEIKFVGNEKIKEDDLKEVLSLKTATPLDEDTVRANVKKIREHYVKEGYFLAEVKSDLKTRDDGDIDVVFDIKEYSKVKVKHIEILGNEALTDEDLKAHIFTREESVLGLLTGAGEYKEDEFKKDLQRLAAWYADNGYPDAKVVDSQIQLSEDRRSMFITFRVEEGPYTTIESVEIAGATPEDEEEIRDLVTIQDKQAFKLSQLFENVKTIQDFYGDKGYAYCTVEPKRRPGAEPNSLVINFDIHKGRQVRIGKITITGNKKTADKVIRREILVNEGDFYHGQRVRLSEETITRTGFFDKVSVTTQASKDPNFIDVLVEVTERATGSFQVGAGFSSAESFIGTLQISQQNFLGRGQYLTAQATISGLRQLFNLQFFEPYFLDSKWRFKISLFKFEYEYTDFTRDSFGGNLGFGYPITRNLTIDLTYTAEKVSVEPDGALGSAQRNIGSIFHGGFTSSLSASIVWDRRNNRIYPSKGFMLQGNIEVADQYLGSENEFIRMVGTGRLYFNILQRLIFKFNLELGLVASWNANGKEVPLFERFFVGGPNSVRGFERSSLGPTRSIASDISDPGTALTKFTIGGDKELVFNAELEIPIIQSMGISAVLFYDMGNAFNEDQSLTLKADILADSENEIDATLRTAMGFGLRWMSPMGLLRFEWGFPLRHKSSEDPMVFEFSIGNAF